MRSIVSATGAAESTRLLLAVFLAAGLLAAAASPGLGQSIRLPQTRSQAPPFPDDFKWLNTDKPLALDGNLKGHVVILDFWTYCCINCMHVLPDLHHIEQKYADDPVAVVGVHSAKFETEQQPQNIRQAIQRYRIQHPVIVDENHTIWRQYGVRAWPTFMILDSEGNVVGRLSGEGNRQVLDQVVATLLEEGRKKGTLAEERIELNSKPKIPPHDQLAFPGKITGDAKGKRLFIADSNHDRIVVTDLTGKVKHVIGAGEPGLEDGSFGVARFRNPQGMAFDATEQILYVADTDNHSIRKLDLKSKQVTTIAGTGEKSGDRTGGEKGTSQGLTSPWDLALHENKLYIAMAGTHQLWVHHLDSGVSERFAGPAGFAEGIVDGPAESAELAQPSGLAILGDWLYFADSETSAVRRASLRDGRVETLIGHGLFQFGHKNGPWDSAMLQHVLGVAPLGDNLVVADTYNNALRLLDREKETIRTLHGGPDKQQLDEPGGLAVVNGQIYIADTNHHRIVRFDPDTGEATPLNITVPVKDKKKAQ